MRKYNKLSYLLLFLILILFLFSGKNNLNNELFEKKYPFLNNYIDYLNKNLNNIHYNNSIYFKYFKNVYGTAIVYKKIVDFKKNKFFSYFLVSGKIKNKKVNFFIKGFNSQGKIIFYDYYFFPVDIKIKNIDKALNYIKNNDNNYSLKILNNNIDIVLNSFENRKLTFINKIRLKKGKYIKSFIFYLNECYVIDEITINNKSKNWNTYYPQKPFHIFSFNNNVIYEVKTDNINKILDIEIKYHLNYKLMKEKVYIYSSGIGQIRSSLAIGTKNYFHISSGILKNIPQFFPINLSFISSSKININFINKTNTKVYTNFDNNINKKIKLKNISIHISKVKPLIINTGKIKYNIFFDEGLKNNNTFKKIKSKLEKLFMKYEKQIFKIYGQNLNNLNDNFYIFITDNINMNSTFCEPLNITMSFVNFNKGEDYFINSFYLALIHEMSHYFCPHKISLKSDNFYIFSENFTEFLELNNLRLKLIEQELNKKIDLNSSGKIITFIINTIIEKIRNQNDKMENIYGKKIIPVVNKPLQWIKYSESYLYFTYLYYLMGENNFKKLIGLIINYNNSENLYFEDYLLFIKQSVSEEKYKIIENFIYDTLFTDKINFEKYGKIEDVAEYVGNIFKKSILDGL